MVDRNAYKGAMALIATVNKLRSKGVAIEVLGVVRNQVDHHRSTYQLLNDALVDVGLPLLRTEIPMRAGFQNAVTAGVPLVHFDPSHAGAHAIRALAGELTGRSASLEAA